MQALELPNNFKYTNDIGSLGLEKLTLASSSSIHRYNSHWKHWDYKAEVIPLNTHNFFWRIKTLTDEHTPTQ
jgi:hypothetical protein